MGQHYDVIVIGGGHNGLVNAAYLAKAGKKVVVLERRHVLGGAAVTEEIIPGFLFSECSYVVSLLRPEIIRELDLPRHGLEILPLDGTFSPMPSGDYLWRMNDHAKSVRDIRRHSRLDAEAYDEFSKMMTPMCRFMKPMLSMVPPDPTSLNPKDLKQLHFLLQRFRELSSDERYTLVQLMTMSSADFLDQWFETDVLKATMSASGIIGTFLGIRSPGTAYVLLHHYMGEIDGAFRSWGFSRGGTGAISNAIADAAREAGVEIRTKAPVGKILVKNGRACGVALQDGEELTANIGSSGKVNLALDALPSFKCLPGPGAHLRGAISISPSMEYMERAYDDAKYGNFSRRPYVDMVIPSLTDPTVAPPGKHVLSCFVQYAPYKLAQGTWDVQKEAFGENVINTIAEYAPNIKDIIIGRQILTPLVLERREMVGGGAITEEFHPGFKASTLAHTLGPLRTEIARDMQIEKFGCEILYPGPRVFAPAPDGKALLFWNENAKTAQGIANFSPKDSAKYLEFADALDHLTGVLDQLVSITPPAIDKPTPEDLWNLLKTGRNVRMLRKKGIFDLLRWGPMAVADFVSEFFETELIRAVIAARGIFGTALGPWSAGSTAVLLLRAASDTHPVGTAAFPRG